MWKSTASPSVQRGGGGHCLLDIQCHRKLELLHQFSHSFLLTGLECVILMRLADVMKSHEYSFYLVHSTFQGTNPTHMISL